MAVELAMAGDHVEPVIGTPTRANRGQRCLLWASIATLVVIAIVGVFGQVIAPYGATEASLIDRLQPPFWQTGGSSQHWLGTDDVGRDILSRILIGTRLTLIVSLAALVLGMGFGTLIGLISGFSGGAIDAALMRTTDVAIGFPMILIALLLAVAYGPDPLNVIISVSLILWSRFARVVRAEVLSLRERDFIASARVSGASRTRIIVRHLLPNVMNTVIVLATLQMGWVIVVEASLSFLGAGIPAPQPAWGAMVAGGRNYIATAWWVSAVPGVAIVITVMAFNLVGDFLRDRLDPTLQQ